MPKRLSAEQLETRADAFADKYSAAKVESARAIVRDIMAKYSAAAQPCADFLTKWLKRQLADELPTVEQAPVVEQVESTEPVWKDQYTKPSATPVKLLKALLQHIDPITYSDGNMRTLCLPNQREPPKTDVCEVFEFVFEQGPDEPIPPSCRNLPKMKQLSEMWHIKSGRVGVRLVMRPVWPNVGVYEVSDRRTSKAGVWARRRYVANDPWLRIPVEYVGQIELLTNYSTLRASVAETDGSNSYKLILLFRHDERLLPPVRGEQPSQPPRSQTNASASSSIVSCFVGASRCDGSTPAVRDAIFVTPSPRRPKAEPLHTEVSTSIVVKQEQSSVCSARKKQRTIRMTISDDEAEEREDKEEDLLLASFELEETEAPPNLRSLIEAAKQIEKTMPITTKSFKQCELSFVPPKPKTAEA